MADLYLLFNHRFTKRQEEDALRSLGVNRIVPLPPNLKRIWSNIPPGLPEISAYIQPLRNWLAAEAAPGDFALIQGDFGACFLMVRFAFENDVLPVYSTTAREAVEEHLADGSVRAVHRFKHKMFRVYGK